MAEDYGAIHAARLSGGATLVIDRHSTVAHAGDPGAAKAAESVTAGLWRALPAAQWPQARKVKAHRSRQQAEADGSLHDWLGNDQADSMANRAARLNRYSASTEREYLRRLNVATTLVHMAIDILALWPDPVLPAKAAKVPRVPSPSHAAA